LPLTQQAPCQRPDNGIFINCFNALRGLRKPGGGSPKYIFFMRATAERAKKICVFKSMRIARGA
jgi:hypothetical protein